MIDELLVENYIAPMKPAHLLHSGADSSIFLPEECKASLFEDIIDGVQCTIDRVAA